MNVLGHEVDEDAVAQKYAGDFCEVCNAKMLKLMKPIYDRQIAGKIPFPWDVTRMLKFSNYGLCNKCKYRVLKKAKNGI